MLKNLLLFLISYFLILLLAREIDANRLKSRWEVKRKSWLESRVENSFRHKVSGHFIYHSITGTPMHPHSLLSKYSQSLHLWLLFSFNFFHYNLFLSLFKNEKFKKIKKFIRFIPLFPFPSIFRIQIIFLLKYFFPKLKQSAFVISFLISALLGHFTESPQGFALSFGFIGMNLFTFFEKKLDETLFMALILLLFSLVFKKDFSLIGFLISIPIIYSFKKIYSFIFLVFIFCFITGESYLISIPIDFVFKKIIPFIYKLSLNTQTLATGWFSLILFFYFINKRLSFLLLGSAFFIDFAHSPTFILK